MTRANVTIFQIMAIFTTFLPCTFFRYPSILSRPIDSCFPGNDGVSVATAVEECLNQSSTFLCELSFDESCLFSES